MKNSNLTLTLDQRICKTINTDYLYSQGATTPLNLLAIKEVFIYKEDNTWNNKWDLMMSGPASLAVISFIKLRLLVDLRIFSKFQGA